MEAETLKRKHSEGEIKTSEIKKTKTDEELKLDDKKNIAMDDDKGDDLLKRLEAIVEPSSGKADLKLDEIETNEKDDLLNRLEEAELGDISLTKDKIIVSEDKKDEKIVVVEKAALDDTLDISTDIVILDSTIDDSLTSSSQNKNVKKMDVEEEKLNDENITKVIEQSSIDSEDGNLHRQATAVIGDIEKMDISDDELKVTTTTSSTSTIDKTLSDTRSLGGTTDDDVIIKFASETNIPDDKPEKEITVSIDTIIRDKLNSKTPMMMNNGSSTPNSNNTSASAVNHMFNSTPIQKLSKMKAESESLLSNLTESTEIITETTDEDHICSSSAETSSQQTSGDSLEKFAKVIKKYNGITAATDDEKSKKMDCETPENTTCLSLANGSSMEISNFDEEIYEITFGYEDNDMKYLCVEKADKIKKHGRATPLTDYGGGTDSSGKRSSNGSVGSIGPFSLPAQRSSVMSSSASSSLGSQKTEDGKFAIPAQPQKTRHTVKGLSALCTFFIDHFTKVKYSLNESNVTENDGTPRGKGRQPVKKTLIKNESPDVTEKSKKKKKDDLNESLDPPGQCVLARWVDKKYYAGQVTAIKPGNKFVILFQDGASKTLPADSIVFGTNDILPLIDQSVHALVSDETYEPGLVTSFKPDEFNNIIYTVITESGTIDVTASDIYLDEDQAKMIQGVFKGDASTPTGKRIRSTSKTDEILSGPRSTRGKRIDKNIPNTEAGCSGIIAKGKKGRAKKIVSNVSESSDISDTMEDSAPNSPDSALEAVDGVQPELQKTPREAELNKMSLIAEYLGNDKTKDFDDILGPIPTNKSLFKNKHFIITCTIPMKEPRTEIKEDDLESMTNKHKKFTTTPFVKQHIIKQIESGGGKVYNHFEEIPKNKYNQCKLIAPHPCITAKYVQCLAVDIHAVSHEWIIESCQKGSVSPYKNFILPSGWSILEEKYIKWAVGRTSDHRSNAKPLSGQVVLMASQNHDFSEFWSRVCKQAGATIRLIKTQTDITETQSGFMLSDDEFPQEIKSKAEHYGIPIVSSVWVVQSLIVGKALEPNAHEKLKQIYVDDDY